MVMTREAKTKIYKVGARHTLYLQKDFVTDSSFPFAVNEELTARIEGETIIIAKLKEAKI
jgi:hypothetical protein